MTPQTYFRINIFIQFLDVIVIIEKIEEKFITYAQNNFEDVSHSDTI